MIQWLFDQTIKIAQYGQGIGAAGKRQSKADRAVLRQLKSHLNGAKPVIFDVGANRGDFVQLALDEWSGSGLTIHAFEPSRVAFLELARRFDNRKDIVTNNLALSVEAGERTLYYDVAGSELSSLYPRRVDHHGLEFTGTEQVQVQRLDGYCAAHAVDHLDLLKLDVEGHELAVLQGASKLFQRQNIGMVSFEFGGCNIDSRNFLRDFHHFFAAHKMKLARVTALGRFREIAHYHEGLEQFRTTCFVATAQRS
jgi:FkbM family methyltransferase